MSWLVWSITVVVCVIAGVTMWFARRDEFIVHGKTVLITGGSQGMGRGVARLLAQKGANVILVARNVDKLKAAVAYISSVCYYIDSATLDGERFHHISADLTDPAESIRVFEEATTWNGNRCPDVVWCVAGSSQPGFFVEMDVGRLREQMDQNYWTAAYMAHSTLKEWLRPSSSGTFSHEPVAPDPVVRHLIFTSTIAAFYPPAGYSQYAPAKTALRTLSDVLAQEVRLYNGARSHRSPKGPAAEVRIHTIFPGTILGLGLDQENSTKPGITLKLEEGDQVQTEDEVAAASLKGLEKGEYLITTTFLGSVMRGASWCGSPRNNWFVDTIFTWIASIVWIFAQPDLDGKATKWGKEHGHPAFYGSKDVASDD